MDVKPAQHFIDGQFVDSRAGRTFETINPADQRPITTVADGQAEDIDRAVRAARRAFAEGPWARGGRAADRSRLLRRIGDLINKHGDELAVLETLDTGLPIRQARGQAARAAENFYFFAEMATRMTGESFPVDGSFINYSILRPVGVAGLITPWNTPFMLETWKVAPCLAAGNTCVLKPAEWSPLSAGFLARIIQEADLPPGVFNLVNGFGETAGAPLVAHPDVNLISFTGETTTGMEIMRNGAATLKRYSMELGGKSPAVVFADSDLDAALDAVIFGVYSLNGERCTANSRLLIEQSVHDRFVERLAAGREDPGRRPVPGEHGGWAADPPGALGAGAGLHRHWQARGRDCGGRRDPAGCAGARQLRRPDADHRRAQRDADRPGGDLRAGHGGDSVPG